MHPHRTHRRAATAAASLLLASIPALAEAPPLAPSPLAQSVMKEISAQEIRRHIDKLASFGTRHTLSAADDPERGIGAARAWLLQTLQDAKRALPERPLMKVEAEIFDQAPVERMPSGGQIVNLVATIPGMMKEAAARRYYIVAHYDSMPTDKMDFTSDAPGSNDDASGVAAILEIARVLSSKPLDSTIVLLCTAGEEQGLLGAKYHVEQAAKRGDDIRGVLNNDIVGDPSPATSGRAGPFKTVIRVFSEGLPTSPRMMQLEELRRLAGENDSPSRQIARYIRDVAEREKTRVQPVLIFRPDRFLRGGDHGPFNERGFPAVRFTCFSEDYTRQHQNVREENGVRFGDRPENVDAEYLADVARLNAAVLVHMANAPSTPEHARIITAKLETATTLRWEKSPEPDVAGYEIVWRETTSPFWDHVQDVGDKTEITLDINKDNVFFGIRAYDKDGYRSPAAFPGAATE